MMEAVIARMGDSEVTRQNSLARKAKQLRNISQIILFPIVAIFYLIPEVTLTALRWFTLVPTFFIPICVVRVQSIMPAYIFGGFMDQFMAFGSDFSPNILKS